MSALFDAAITGTAAADPADPSDAAATSGTGTCDRCQTWGLVRTQHGLLYAYQALCGPCVRDLPPEPTRTPVPGPPTYEPPPRLPEEGKVAPRWLPSHYLAHEPGPPTDEPRPPTYTPPPRAVDLCTHCGLAFTPEHLQPHWSDGYTASWDLTAVPEALRAPPPSGSL